MADPGIGESPGPDPPHGGPAPGGAGSIAEQVGRARLRPAPGEVPVQEAGWLSTLADGSDRPASRVAALTQTAATALRLGRAGGCFAALAEQRAGGGGEPAATGVAAPPPSRARQP